MNWNTIPINKVKRNNIVPVHVHIKQEYIFLIPWILVADIVYFVYCVFKAKSALVQLQTVIFDFFKEIELDYSVSIE